MDYNKDYRIQEIYHYYEMDRYEVTIQKIDEYLSYDPMDGARIFLKADCCFRLERYQEAKDICIQAITNHYSLAECYFLLGNIEMRLGYYSSAENYYIDALQYNPNAANVIAKYSFLMLKTNHLEKAKKLLQEAIRIDPLDETVNQIRFLTSIYKNNKKAITSSLEKFMVVGKNEIVKYMNLGIMELNNNNYRVARENFRQAFLLNPTNKDICSQLEELEEISSPLYFPQRMIEKMGGSIMVSVLAIILVFIYKLLHFNIGVFIIGICYLFIWIYIGMVPHIYRVFKH